MTKRPSTSNGLLINPQYRLCYYNQKFLTLLFCRYDDPVMNSNNIIGNTKNTDEENDLIVQSWIYDVISSMRPALLTCLKESVYSFLNSISEGCRNPDGTFND